MTGLAWTRAELLHVIDSAIFGLLLVRSTDSMFQDLNLALHPSDGGLEFLGALRFLPAERLRPRI